MRDKTVGYSDLIDADDQISMEEKIAATIFDDPDVEINEQDAAELGRKILFMVLAKFRPDLIQTSEVAVEEIAILPLTRKIELLERFHPVDQRSTDSPEDHFELKALVYDQVIEISSQYDNLVFYKLTDAGKEILAAKDKWSAYADHLEKLIAAVEDQQGVQS